MPAVWSNSQFFEGAAHVQADSDAAAYGNQHVGSLWQRLERRGGTFTESAHKIFIPPDIGSARSGIIAGPEHDPDLVILKASRKDVGRAVRKRVRDEYDGTVINLTDVVA